MALECHRVHLAAEQNVLSSLDVLERLLPPFGGARVEHPLGRGPGLYSPELREHREGPAISQDGGLP
jgi:hypothetical protein